jgi:hypothetical protein
MEYAEKYLGIPRVCDVEDLIGPGRDEKIIMTYVSFFRDKVRPPLPVNRFFLPGDGSYAEAHFFSRPN